MAWSDAAIDNPWVYGSKNRITREALKIRRLLSAAIRTSHDNQIYGGGVLRLLYPNLSNMR